MESFLIIALIICGAIIVGFATKFISQAFKLATRLLLLVILIMAVLTYFIYTDIQQLRQDISTGNILFVLAEDDKAYAAVGFNPSENQEIDFNTINKYTEEELAILGKNVKSMQFAEDNTSRVFVFTPKLLNQTYTLDFGVELDENDILQILQSSKPYEVLATKIAPEMEYSAANLAKAYGDEGVIKGYLLAALVINYFKEPKISLHQAIRKEELKVIPETFSFKALKIVPFIGTG